MDRISREADGVSAEGQARVAFLSPVRASKKQREFLGSPFVLTPVIRSARKGDPRPQKSISTLLEETGFCYVPNEFVPFQLPDHSSSKTENCAEQQHPHLS